jgi:tetratricopeptide (TPR) repeat protein
MAFDNRTPYESMDYLTTAPPFELAEKVEQVLGLDPAYGPTVVIGTTGPATADGVAAAAAAIGARWMFTGWVERPNWELKIAVALWKVDGGVATAVGEAVRVGPFNDVHRFVGECVIELAGIAKWTVPEAAVPVLVAKPTADLYAFSLFGRGVGHLIGVEGTVNLKLAQSNLERAVFIAPTMVEAQRLLGEILRTTATEPRQINRSTGKFNYAIDLRPAYAPALRAAADAAREAGKDELSVDLYRRLVMRRPWDLDARFRLGEGLWKIGDDKAAVDVLDAIAARRPDDLATRRVLALIHAARGDTAKLVSELEAIRKRAPADLDVVRDLAGAYAAQSKWQQAIDAYQIVAAARPLDVTLAKRIGDVERWRGDPAAADAWYARAMQLAPDDPRAYFAAAQSWLDRNLVDEAHRVLIRAQRFKDQLGPVYHALGVLALRGGRADEAAWYLRRAVKLRPRSLVTRVAVVAAELARGDRATAQLQLAPARIGWPDDADLLYLEGITRARGGDRGGARERMAKALEKDRDHAPARTALSALDAGGEVRVTVEPAIDLPYGDARTLVRALDRFDELDGKLLALRGKFQGLALTILGVLGEGPTKIKADALKIRGAARRACPINDVVRHWRDARGVLDQFFHVGVELEDAHRYVARHDDLGEAAALLPDQRARVNDAQRRYRLDLADVRELRAMWQTAVGRELKSRGCNERLLEAAAADPQRYAVRIPPRKPEKAPVVKPRRPRRASFFVDNRKCKDDVTVFVDGEPVGKVAADERAALYADAGRRTVCLIVGAASTCGDRGTVRQIYLHEGWEAVMRCTE